jgi:hypothetical protein
VSLLDLGPDVVTVYPEVESEDEYGNTVMVPSDEGVSVRGRWQPGTAEESAAEGQETSTTYRFLCRTFPAGPYARVTFDGSDWDVLGEPKHYRGSTLTGHYTVRLKERAVNGGS